MKNWVHSKHPFGKRIRRKVSKTLLELGARYPRLLTRLHEISERSNTLSRADRVGAPAHFGIRPVKLAFSELYLIEEFAKVEEGLNRLARAAPTRFPYFRRDRGQQMDAEGSSKSWGREGWFDLSRLPKGIRPRYLHYLSAISVRPTPSTRLMSFVTTVTPAFVESFATLAASDGGEEVDLAWVRGYGVVAGAMTPAWVARQTAYDALFLETNRELVRILRRFLGVGRCMQGPLQAIEVLSIDTPITSLPDGRATVGSADDDSEFRASVFFNTLGRQSPSFVEYRRPEQALYPVKRDGAYDINSFQLVLGGVPTDTEHSTEDAGRREHLEELGLSRIAAALALLGFYRQLRRASLQARDQIAPVVANPLAVRRVRKAHERMTQANALFFRENRVWTEFGESFARRFVTEELESFIRFDVERRDAPPNTFAKDFWAGVDHHHQFCQEQLMLLRQAFSEALAYATIVASDSLQRAVLWLSVVATCAAVLAIPESAWRWLGELLLRR